MQKVPTSKGKLRSAGDDHPNEARKKPMVKNKGKSPCPPGK